MPLSLLNNTALRLLGLFGLLFLAYTAIAAPPGPVPAPPVQTLKPPPAPQIAARAYILQDFESGRVLIEQNADELLEPASLTKLMTAYVVFSQLKDGRFKPTDKVRISEKAWRTAGSRMYLELDSEVPVEELLKGMIIQSGNDASVALAEFVAGSEDSFVAMMNQYAARLGLTHSHYLNSTGMPMEGHVTTTRDMARMARSLIRHFPEYYSLYSEKEYTYNDITQHNRNALLWRDNSVDGVKTGYTEAAGYCLVSSAKRNNMRLIGVVMGTESKKARASESQKMLNYGFRFYETLELYKPGNMLDSQRVWMGTEEQIPLGVKHSLWVTIPRERARDLSATTQVKHYLEAPIYKDTDYGEVRVSLDGEEIARAPLVALKSIPEGNFFQQTLDYILLQFE